MSNEVEFQQSIQSSPTDSTEFINPNMMDSSIDRKSCSDSDIEDKVSIDYINYDQKFDSGTIGSSDVSL